MGKKILLADDSLTIQKVVELTLAGTDYELTCVSNGQKALESLRALAARPDSRRRRDAREERLRGLRGGEGGPGHGRIPVLLLSGTFEPFDRDRADRVRADRVVSKPFDAPHLLDEIDSLLSPDSGAAPRDSSSYARSQFEASFLDDTIPTGAGRGSESSGRSLRRIPSSSPGGRGSARRASGNASGDSRSAPCGTGAVGGIRRRPVFLAAPSHPGDGKRRRNPPSRRRGRAGDSSAGRFGRRGTRDRGDLRGEAADLLRWPGSAPCRQRQFRLRSCPT